MFLKIREVSSVEFVKSRGKEIKFTLSHSSEAVFHSNVCITYEWKNRRKGLHAC